MIALTIAVSQMLSPFILIGLMLYWVYRVSKKADDCLKKVADLQKGEEILHHRISSVDDGLYKKILSVEETVEELDGVVIDILDDLLWQEENGKPSS
jgi:preprotein translocase subunit YajC